MSARSWIRLGKRVKVRGRERVIPQRAVEPVGAPLVEVAPQERISHRIVSSSLKIPFLGVGNTSWRWCRF